jgi:predicted transglutaminase-like cysteine proteinase
MKIGDRFISAALVAMTALTATYAMAGSDPSRYIEIASETHAPIGWIEFCRSNERECATAPSAPRDIVLTETVQTPIAERSQRLGLRRRSAAGAHHRRPPLEELVARSAHPAPSVTEPVDAAAVHLVTRTSARLRIVRGEPDQSVVLAWSLCSSSP